VHNPAADNTPCTDNDVCTQGDACQSGTCRPGTTVNCNDGNDCTTDSCNPQTGCANASKADNTICNDGNACTTGDKCTNGKCGGIGLNCDDNNPCTTDTCDPVMQQCSHANVQNNTPCSDNDKCTLNDTCQNGQLRCGADGELLGHEPLHEELLRSGDGVQSRSQFRCDVR